MKLFIFLFLSFTFLFSSNIQKILINPTEHITIPALNNESLKEFSFSIKDTKINEFYIAKYETTISEYITYLKSSHQIDKIKEITNEYTQEAITNVNFDTATKVCKYYGGRLPSELEWIVASSIKVASSKCYEHIEKNSFSNFATGSYPLEKNNKQIKCMAKLDDEMDVNLIGSELLEVEDSYENINGTYGMLGNVWEWVNNDKFYFKQKYKAIKGGSFANFEQKKLYDNRISNFLKPEVKMNNVGFRCAWDRK